MQRNTSSERKKYRLGGVKRQKRGIKIQERGNKVTGIGWRKKGKGQ